MNADPSAPSPLEALRELEPEPPPRGSRPELDEDHYFDDDLEPSWWSITRPRPNARLPRARTADDEASTAAIVLGVRARLTLAEERAFDELMCGPAATDILTMLVNCSEDDAVARLRRRLADEPALAEERSFASQIIAVSALLSTADRTNALTALGSLLPEELHALQSRLIPLPVRDAAALIRTYLAPRR